MTESADSYLCFQTGGVCYITPVPEVERICTGEDAGGDDELVWIRPGQPKGQIPAKTADDRACVVILREEEHRYAIPADVVEGVTEILPSEQYEVPALLWPYCPWLFGVAVQPEKKRLLLLLNGQKLEAEPDAAAFGQDAWRDTGVTEKPEAYLQIAAGKRFFPIRREELVRVLFEPVITRVLSKESFLYGILYENKEMIPLLDLSGGEFAREKSFGRTCILLERDSQIFAVAVSEVKDMAEDFEWSK